MDKIRIILKFENIKDLLWHHSFGIGLKWLEESGLILKSCAEEGIIYELWLLILYSSSFSFIDNECSILRITIVEVNITIIV
jgi:hypothetical protein